MLYGNNFIQEYYTLGMWQSLNSNSNPTNSSVFSWNPKSGWFTNGFW